MKNAQKHFVNGFKHFVNGFKRLLSPFKRCLNTFWSETFITRFSLFTFNHLFQNRVTFN